MGSAENNQAPIEVQHRLRIAAFSFSVDALEIGADRQPGRTDGEACVWAAIPLHWSALRVAAEVITRHKPLKGILHLGFWYGDALHAQLVAGIEDGSPRKRKQKHGRDTRLLHPNAGCYPGLVVTTQDPIGPCTFGKDIEIF